MTEQNVYSEEKQEGQAVGKAVGRIETELEGKSQGNLRALLSELPRRTEALAGLQMSMPGRHTGSVNELLVAGALDLFNGLAPADAIETMLSMLAVGITSASMDCLAQAASTPPDYLERRDLNLRHGFKGAAVAAELIKALGARRGNSVPSNVTVRDVNVEAGAQAIIGNVEAPRRKADLAPRGAEPVAQPSDGEI